MAGPTRDFWKERFASGTTPWNRGAPNPQIEQWIADGTLAPGNAVIVPGCGHGWEVAALAQAGMMVVGIDFAANALDHCRQVLTHEGVTARLIDADVLHWQPDAPVDAVFEQTCLCALYPDFWQRYAAQLHAWLKPDGKLLALFMQVPRPESAHGFIDGPPYHCDINAMRALFPATLWNWPKPPYPQVENPAIERTELAVLLVRK
jgi:cyclopropane fatty-acyl-phospholipid synthase-like methyltransferase